MEVVSRLDEILKRAIRGSFDSIPELVELLTLDISKVGDDLRIENKTIERANREQPELLYHYSRIHQKLKVIVKTINQKIDDKKAIKYKQYKTTSNIALSSTDLNRWVDGDTEIHALYSILLLVEDHAYQYDAIVKSFEARGYALKNITESRINMIDKMTIV